MKIAVVLTTYNRPDALAAVLEGWGLEDSDLTLRLLHSGVRRKSARFAAPMMRLWHPENDRASLDENRGRLDALLQSKEIRATCGVNQYL